MTVYKINPKALSWTPPEQIEPQALAQIERLSTMPFIFQHVAVMPDCHLGSGATVGTCIPTMGAVIPAAIGVDVGCGMIAARTPFTRDEMPRDLAALREEIESAIPLTAGRYNEDLTESARRRTTELGNAAHESGRLDFYEQRVPNWRLQLGSLGSGNHFIELVEDEDARVWAFLHSGSRGIGSKIATYHMNVAKDLMQRWFIELPDPDLSYLALGSPEFKTYMTDIHWLQEFALQNRAEMMDRVLAALRTRLGPFEPDEVIECHHNFSRWEHHMGKNIIVSRKGAIQAYPDQLGLIPGSMGTRSYVVKGRGDVASFKTAPHGAGRRMGRMAARSAFTMDDFDRDMAGIEVRRTDAFLDELPGAYKDVDLVMEQSEPLVEVVHTLRQFVNIKGDSEERPWERRRAERRAARAADAA